MPVVAVEGQHELGRVFLTPSERAVLDQQREEYYLPPDINPIEEIPIEVVEEPEPGEEEVIGPALVVNGFVKRIGTSGTVWINGESTYDGDMANMNVDHLKTKIIGTLTPRLTRLSNNETTQVLLQVTTMCCNHESMGFRVERVLPYLTHYSLPVVISRSYPVV